MFTLIPSESHIYAETVHLIFQFFPYILFKSEKENLSIDTCLCYLAEDQGPDIKSII